MEDKVVERLQNKNIKPTAIRILVLQHLKRCNNAIGLADLEEAFDKVERTTLYRTLKTFEEKCIVHSIDDGTGVPKYALCEEACECKLEHLHIHFHCISCGKTFCLKDLSIPNIELPTNFKSTKTNMVVQGVCEKCKE